MFINCLRRVSSSLFYYHPLKSILFLIFFLICLTCRNEPTDNSNNFSSTLLSLGYSSDKIPEILDILDTLCNRIGFSNHEKKLKLYEKGTDIDFQKALEPFFSDLQKTAFKDLPSRQRYLSAIVANLYDKNIFDLINISNLSIKDRIAKQDFLLSCSAISQLGYILFKKIGFSVQGITVPGHTSLIIKRSSGNFIVVDLSVNRIRAIEPVKYYEIQNDWYFLKNSFRNNFKNDEYVFFRKRFVSGKVLTTDQLVFSAYNDIQQVGGRGVTALLLNNLACVFGELNFYDDAILLLQKSIAMYPRFEKARINLGLYYSLVGMNKNAANLYNEIVLLNPRNSEIYEKLGDVLIKVDQKNKALESYYKAVALDSVARIFAKIGDLSIDLKRIDKAYQAFRCALIIDPDDFETAHKFGTMLLYLGQQDYAIKIWSASYLNNPDLVRNYPDTLKLEINKTMDSMRKFIDQSIASTKNTAETMLPSSIMPLYKEWKESHPDTGIMTNNRTNILRGLITQKTIDDSNEVIAKTAFDAGNLAVKIAKEFNKQNNKAFEKGFWESSLNHYKQVLTYSKKTDIILSAYKNIAFSAIELGNYDEPIMSLNKLLQFTPDDVVAAYLLGDIFWVTNRKNNAIQVWSNLIQYNPIFFDKLDNEKKLLVETYMRKYKIDKLASTSPRR